MKELKEQKRYLKRWYDKTAKRYDIWESKEKLVSESYKQEMGGIKKLLKVKKGDIVLDAATGTGNYLILMAQKGAICYGIDISPKILEVAKKKAEKLNLKNVKELKIGDADKIPYSDKFFDWINCVGMFEYYPIEHVKKIFLEFRRVLKNKGKIVVDFPDINNQEAHKFREKSESVKTKVYLYNFKTVEKVIKDLGLKILKKQIRGFEIQLLLQPE